MAGFHKKRRRPGPSKNDEKVSRGKDEERLAHPSNWLGNRYDSVQGLALAIELIGTHNELLGQESRKFGRDDACGFSFPCPGLCGGGTFDLGVKISEIVATKEPHSEFSVVCQHKTYSGPSTVCGVTLKCRLDVVYKAAPV
ncbi:MAG: hypothetical protein HY077_03115 [Elusimicrobia bacterium]|nr:hypothetical protein [Elusimicrobiota bacterium]